MPSVTYDRFDKGLDRRRGASTSDANALRVLTNADVTTGKQIRKRPGLQLVASLEAGTKGLKSSAGKLHTFYESGSITHSNPLFLANKVPHPTTSQDVARVWSADTFNGYLYAAVEYADGSVVHQYLDGTVPAYVSDPNCPQSKIFRKAASKLFALGDETVPFCATNDARDWTTANDAGFLAVGIKQEGSTNPTGLGEFQKRLVVTFEDGLQTWTVDPDPANMDLFQRLSAVGTQYPLSIRTFAELVMFLGPPGVRAIAPNNSTPDNAQEVDSGTPIDRLIQDDVDIATSVPMGLYASSLGRYLLFVDDHAWVYTQSRLAKIAGWSYYQFPFTIDDATVLGGDVYVRNGNNVFKMAYGQYTDNGTLIDVQVTLPFVDAKRPNDDKIWYWCAGVARGTCDMSFLYDPRDESLETTPVQINGDIRGEPWTTVELSSVSIAPVIRHSANEDFELEVLSIGYDVLGKI